MLCNVATVLAGTHRWYGTVAEHFPLRRPIFHVDHVFLHQFQRTSLNGTTFDHYLFDIHDFLYSGQSRNHAFVRHRSFRRLNAIFTNHFVCVLLCVCVTCKIENRKSSSHRVYKYITQCSMVTKHKSSTCYWNPIPGCFGNNVDGEFYGFSVFLGACELCDCFG